MFAICVAPEQYNLTAQTTYTIFHNSGLFVKET